MRRAFRSRVGVVLLAVGIVMAGSTTAGSATAGSVPADPAAADPSGTAGEWAFARRDLQNTGHQPLHGRITEPEVKDRVHLGGATAGITEFDLDGDGAKELLSVEGGMLVARNADLEMLWANATLGVVTTVVGVYDLDGDGANELVVLTGGALGINVVSADDGTSLWGQRYTGALNLGRVGVASLDPSLPGKQITLYPDRATHVTTYAFDQGVEDGYVLWTSPDLATPEPSNFTASVLVADLNAGGDNEVAIASYGFIETYDGATGEPLTTANGGWNGRLDYVSGPGVNGRNYGPFKAVPQPGSPYPLLVIAATDVTMHIQVADNGPAGLSLLYDEFIKYTFDGNPGEAKAVQALPEAIGPDFLGNGRPCMAVSIYNHTGDGRWHLYVIDLLNGFASPLLDVPDGYLRGAADLDGDGAAELMASLETAQAPGTGTPLRLYSEQSGALAEVWTLAAGTFWALRADIVGDAAMEFFVSSGGQIRAYEYSSGSVAEVWTHASAQFHRAGDLDGDGDGEVVFTYPDGRIEIEDAATQAVEAQGGLSGTFGQPTVATMTAGGHSQVVVPVPQIAAYSVTPAGEVRVYEWSDGSGGLEQNWTTPGVGVLPQSAGRTGREVAKADNAVPLFDLDDDGSLEMLVTDRVSNQTRVRLLDADGAQIWAHTFAAPDAIGMAYSWVVGNFRPGDGKDIFLSGLTGGFNTEVSFVLDGANGNVLWKHQTIQHPQNGANRAFGPCCAFPAVADLLDSATLVDGYAGAGVLSESQAQRLRAELRVMKQGTGRAADQARDRYLALAGEIGDDEARAALLAAADSAGLDQVILQAKDVLAVVRYDSGSSQFQVDTAGWVSNPVEGTSALYQGTMITDLEGDGTVDWLGIGGYLGMFQETLGVDASGNFVATHDWFVGTPEWDLYEFRPAVADVTGDGVADAGLVHLTGVFDTINAATGATQWTHDLGAPSRSAAAVDINDDGATEYVVGTIDGRLVALNGAVNASPRELWSLDIGTPVGNVTVADVDGDDYSEILFTAGDGYLYVVGQA